MPDTIIGKKFLVMSKLLNDLASPEGRRLFPDLHTVGRIELGIVARTVFIEQMAGRRVTPYSVANIADVPRATVERRFREMIQRGILVKGDRTYSINPEWLHSEVAEQRIERACRLVIEAAQDLQALNKKS